MSTVSERVLIVNADDLGRTPGINDGIFEAHRRGLVTSATLMVTHPAAEAAAAALADHPGLGVGLHVALTGGNPALPPERVPSLVDADGRLPPHPERIGAPDPNELRAEIGAQLERFRALTGRSPTHLDSHHHSHRLPAVADALAGIASRHRLPVRGAGAESTRHMRGAGLVTPDRFDESFFGAGATLDGLLSVLAELPPGITELMCHPARVDEPLRRDSSYAEERARELAVLTDSRALAAVGEHGVRLAHFGILWPESRR